MKSINKHFIPDSPPVDVLRSTGHRYSHEQLHSYGTYWQYGGSEFNAFPSHWVNGTTFEVRNYLQFKYPMIQLQDSEGDEDYWFANETCQIYTGETFPCEEIFFLKNTEVPLRFSEVVRRGWDMLRITTSYTILSLGKPDPHYFDFIPRNWSLTCLDSMLGVLYDPPTVQVHVSQTARVEVWLRTPPHRIDGNDTVVIQWKAVECNDCITWSPSQLSFNAKNFRERQALDITRVKTQPWTTLQPVFYGGGFDLVLSASFPIYIE